MEDLLHTVRQRYGRSFGYHNLFSLLYRTSAPKTIRRAPPPDTGYREILQTVNRDMLRHVEQWKKQSAREEKRHQEYIKRSNRRIDLFFAKSSLQIKSLRRDMDVLRHRDDEPPQLSRNMHDFPLSYRSAQKMMEERIYQTNAEIYGELYRLTRKNERDILRRMREEQAYEKRRRG